jgi:hypothetical protein
MCKPCLAHQSGSFPIQSVRGKQMETEQPSRCLRFNCPSIIQSQNAGWMPGNVGRLSESESVCNLIFLITKWCFLVSIGTRPFHEKKHSHLDIVLQLKNNKY